VSSTTSPVSNSGSLVMGLAPSGLTRADVIVALVALYAAVVSKLQWIVYLRDARSRIRVTLSLGKILDGRRDNELRLFW
jgi:hypothetical protein